MRPSVLKAGSARGSQGGISSKGIKDALRRPPYPDIYPDIYPNIYPDMCFVRPGYRL
jgi:hypothetical protein